MTTIGHPSSSEPQMPSGMPEGVTPEGRRWTLHMKKVHGNSFAYAVVHFADECGPWPHSGEYEEVGVVEESALLAMTRERDELERANDFNKISAAAAYERMKRMEAVVEAAKALYDATYKDEDEKRALLFCRLDDLEGVADAKRT